MTSPLSVALAIINYDKRIAALEALNLGSRVSTLEGENLTSRLSALENENLDSRISSIENRRATAIAEIQSNADTIVLSDGLLIKKGIVNLNDISAVTATGDANVVPTMPDRSYAFNFPSKFPGGILGCWGNICFPIGSSEAQEHVVVVSGFNASSFQLISKRVYGSAADPNDVFGFEYFALGW